MSKYSISCILGDDDTSNYTNNYTESYADKNTNNDSNNNTVLYNPKKCPQTVLYNLRALSIL
ncbi:hypothetical protein FMO003_35190 [Moritella sp. F3]|nr:hypothetical protein FMO001_19600 [Moritella sp. F1]GIC83239.1 hypothetical protein FMO003_35190 [Moritella sp. F3]